MLHYDRLSVTVQFDANGGTVSSDGDLRTKVWYGGVMGAVQSAPYERGILLQAGTPKKTAEKKLTKETDYDTIAPDGQEQVTVYAHWKEKTP